jgi:hypothetical protein
MLSENEVGKRLDETVNRLAKFKEAFAKDPRGPPQTGIIVESYFNSRIKTLQEVLGIGVWDEREFSNKYKLDPRHWA